MDDAGGVLWYHTRDNMRNKLPLLIPLAIFLLLQAVPIFSVSVAQYDEAIYLDVARSIQRTGLPIRTIDEEGRLLLDQTPLYPYMVSVLTFVLGDNLWLLRMVTVAFGLGTIALVYLIGERTHGPAAGLVGATLLAVNPFFNLYSFYIRMEIFMCFFLVLATYFLANYENTKERKAIIGAGLAILIAVMFKVVAVTYWGAAIIWVAWTARGSRNLVRDALWVIIPTLLGLGAWLGATLTVPGRFEAMLARWQGALGLNPSTIVDPRLGTSDTAWLKLIGNYILHWELVLLAALTLAVYLFTWRRRPRFLVLLILYVLLTVLASLVVSLKEPRHLIGIVPITCLFVGLAIDWRSVWAWVSARPLRLAAATVITAVLLWGLSPLTFPPAGERQTWSAWWETTVRGRYFYNDLDLEPVAAAGQYLSLHSGPDDLIVVVRQGPVAGYYADRHYSLLYTGTFADNMNTLSRHDFLVMDRQEFWNQSPEETALLLEYINENFSPEQAFTGETGTVTVYRRNAPPS